MADQVEHAEAPVPDEPAASEASTQKELDRIADEAALRAIKREDRYEQDHGIFSK